MPRAEIRIDSSSLKGLLTLMEHIDTKVKREGLKNALKAAGKIVVAAAIRRVSMKHRVLQNALDIREKVVLKSAAQYSYAVIGPRRRAGVKIGKLEHIPTKYAHFVEYGTAAHPIGEGDVTNEVLLTRKDKSYKATGKMHPGGRPKPYLRPAWDETKDQALNIIAAILGETIDKGAA